MAPASSPLGSAHEPSTPTGSAERTLDAALERATRRLESLQEADGHWAGDYGGPLFLLPGLVIAYAITGARFTEHQRARMVTYLENVQNADGGFGLHVEDRSTMLGSTLNYTALRLLGVDAGEPHAAKARAWIRAHGGAESVPTWGKVWLAVLGVYEWDGVNPLLPELWLLPPELPVHPANFWCHTRAVFLPMSYLYGRRATGPETEVVRALRDELYTRPYGSIEWPRCRTKVHELDAYSPHTRLFTALNVVLGGFERARSSTLGKLLPTKLRERALGFVMDQIHHEDTSTAYLDIGPVSKALHIVCVWFDDPSSPAYEKHLARVADYLWDGRDGMKMQGYQGSQFWDLAFTMQALLEHEPAARRAKPMVERAFAWLDRNQVREDVPDRERYFRNATRGAFPFSKAEQAWPVTDCTAEGIKAALGAAELGMGALPPERLRDAVDLLLAEQNEDGGWSEYERARAGRWLEILNAAEVFGDIMVGYSHPECSGSCIQGLATFHAEDPSYRRAEVEAAIARGAAYLRAVQRPDGSFYGCWGICFTYAAWFSAEGLIAAGLDVENRRALLAAADFLVGKQRADGGWGESYLSCVEKRYVEHEKSQPVQTAWALLTILATIEHAADRATSSQRASYEAAARRATRYLVETQTDDGWPYDMVYGVFNRNCMINYDNYRYYFPMWALARSARLSVAP